MMGVLKWIHPSDDRVRWAGLAAAVGGALGVLVAPLYSLAYFGTDEAPLSDQSAAARAWAEPARDFFDPLLTFASPDTVYLTYGKLFLFVWIGMLAGLVALHARHAGHRARLERWGFRVSFLGLTLMVIGAFTGYWLGFVDASFAVFLAPGLLLVIVGSVIFGAGTWRAGVAPRAGALLLVVGGPGTLLLSDVATLGGGLVLLYLAWVVLGYAVWSETVGQPAPTSP